jgi:hypothetical protein
VFPAQVITHHRVARGLGLQRTIIIGVHKGLGEKMPSLPKFRLSFNDQPVTANCRTPAIPVICIKKTEPIAKRPEKSTLFSHPDATFKGSHRLSH